MNKIGNIPNKPFPYPDIFSAVINRNLARCGYNKEAKEFFDYARRVEQRYNRLKNISLIEEVK